MPLLAIVFYRCTDGSVSSGRLVCASSGNPVPVAYDAGAEPRYTAGMQDENPASAADGGARRSAGSQCRSREAFATSSNPVPRSAVQRI